MADSSTLVLVLRVAVSLACVLGIIWYANRRLAGSAAVRRQRAASMVVVGRQSLGGKNGLALVDVAGRRLLLGTGEQGVRLLTELEVPPVEEAPERAERTALSAEELADLAGLEPAQVATHLTTGDPAPMNPARHPHVPSLPALPALSTTTPTTDAAARMPAVTQPRHPLDGSILAASTWRRAVVAVQERTIRR